MYREQLENIHTDVGCQGQTIDDSVMEQGGGGGVGKKRLFPRFQGQIDFGFRRDDLENVLFVRKCKNLWPYITT